MGRRLGQRRASVVEVAAPVLPARLEKYRDRLRFVERIEPSSQELEDIDTARLVARIQAGDDEAFTILYMRYFDRVHSYLRLLYRRAPESEDASQQVFVKVLDAVRGWDRSPRTFRPWLFAVARNHALDHLRNLGREEPAEVEALISNEAAAPQEHIAALGWISDRDLHMLVDRLPLAQRQVLFLRYVVGFSTEEVADVLGQSTAAVHKHHARALKFLRDRLTTLSRSPARRGSIGSEIILRKAGVIRARRFALSSPPVGALLRPRR